MIQITDNAVEQQLIPLFRLGFRPFFLAGTIFSAICILLWILLLNGFITLPSQLPPTLWHAHEMLFGFAGAIILGFLLTAVQNWTGSPGLKGKKLAGLFILWLSARVALFALPPQWFWVTFIVEISWMPIAGVLLGMALIYAEQWKNLFFAPLLIIMTLLNAISLISMQSYDYSIAQQAIWCMLFLVLFMIAVMGGRVIPFFTAKGTHTEKTKAILTLEYLSLAPLLMLAVVTWFPSLSFFLSPLAVLAGSANLIRLCRWNPLITFQVPLLWSLHLSYFLLSIGLIFYGLSLMFPLINSTSMIHLSAIGGVGGIILSMISRVSLGHTGRSLMTVKWMSIAFMATAMSAITRVAVPYLLPQSVMLTYMISGLLWISAFTLFMIFYAKILLSPRIDNRPG